MRFIRPMIEYMESQYPNFKKAQGGGFKGLAAFWQGVHTHELKAEVEAHSAAVAKGGKKKVWRPVSADAYAFADAPGFNLEKWKKSRRKRVSRWFYNKAKEEEGKRPEIVVELNPVPSGEPSRALTKQQLYSKRYYKTRVKNKVRAEFAKLGHPPTAGERIAIIHRVTEECFRNETPETKAEIEELERQILEERERRKEVLANALLECIESEGETPESYIRHIEVLKEIFNGVLSALAQKTGWSFTVLCGGPDPMKPDGEIKTVSYHEGRNVHGVTFNKAHPSFHDTYIKPYSAFLHMIYPEDVRRSRVLKTPLHAVMDVMLRLPEDGEVSEDMDETREEALGLPEGGAIVETPSTNLSEVPSDVRAEGPPKVVDSRIPAPREEALGLPEGGVIVETPSTNLSEVPSDVRAEGPPKVVDSRIPAPSGPTVAEVDRATFPPANPNDTPNPLDVAKSGSASPDPKSTASPEKVQTVPSDPPGPLDELTELMNEAARVMDRREAGGPLALQLRPLAGSLASDLGALGADYGDITSLSFEDRVTNPTDYILPPPPPDDATSAPLYGPMAPIAGLADITNFRVNEGSAASQDVSVENNGSGVGTKRTLGDSMDGIRAKRARRGNLESKAWVADVAAVWKSKSDSPAWVRCVDAWVDFEKDKVLESRLPNSKARPGEVTRWVASGRVAGVPPPIDDITDFGVRWVAWWSSLQPKWRTMGIDGLPEPLDPTGRVQSLSTILKPGPTGFAFVLETLLWWRDGGNVQLWGKAVDDVLSCLVAHGRSREGRL